MCVTHCGNLRPTLLEEVHDTPFGGHQGMQRTYEVLQRLFWWPSLREDVEKFVGSCHSCQRNKASHQRTPGLLQPLEIPSRCWDSVSMDFITQLPQSSQGNTQICVFVDRFSKMVHLVALPTDATATVVADAYIQHVFKLHGVAMSIISDRGSVFTSNFWRAVHMGLGTKLSFSSTYHPQSDGQTERMNQVLENMLRTWVNSRQDNWESLLPCAEFAMNNSYSSSTGTTPFRLVSGQDPNTPLSIEINSQSPSANTFV